LPKNLVNLLVNVKTAKQGKKKFAKVNPYIKKYLGKAVKKKTIHGWGKTKPIKITYYTAAKKFYVLK